MKYRKYYILFIYYYIILCISPLNLPFIYHFIYVFILRMYLLLILSLMHYFITHLFFIDEEAICYLVLHCLMSSQLNSLK